MPTDQDIKISKAADKASELLRKGRGFSEAVGAASSLSGIAFGLIRSELSRRAQLRRKRAA